MMNIEIYTDGACSPNPGLGGYGVVIFYEDVTKVELSKGFKNTTNNRMELLSVIDAIKEAVSLEWLLMDYKITVYTDSQYVCNGITNGWANKWKDNQWYRSSYKSEANKIKNPDLWDELLLLCNRHNVEFTWVRGHSENEHNEHCDLLAVAARKSSNLDVDSNYENQVLLEKYYKEDDEGD